MNRIVETLSRIRRLAVAGRRALSAFDNRRSGEAKGATANDQGATKAQQGFHNRHRGAIAFLYEGSDAANGFSNEKTLHLNTTTGYGINLYWIR